MGTAAAAATDTAAPLHDPLTVALQQGESDGRFADAEEKPAAPAEEPAEAEEDEEEEDDEDEDDDYSDDDVREALNWADSMEGPDGRLSATFSGGAGMARRPNAHGGMLSRTLQPLSNRQQKLTSHFRAGPLEVCCFRSSPGSSTMHFLPVLNINWTYAIRELGFSGSLSHS